VANTLTLSMLLHALEGLPVRPMPDTPVLIKTPLRPISWDPVYVDATGVRLGRARIEGPHAWEGTALIIETEIDE